METTVPNTAEKEKENNDDELVAELTEATEKLIIEEIESYPPFIENEATEIVFYDVETTVPATDMIEFGAIVLDKRGLFEKESFTTLIHSTKITKRSIEVNGITPQMVSNAPTFEKVADKIFSLLDGKIWAGHNITTFDNKQIIKQFQNISKTPPKPTGVIDTLHLLRSTFGKRAGDMKMASLGNYFRLGEEKHRALDDSRMTLEVFKNCCMTIFLEERVGRSIPKKPKPKKTATPKPKTPSKASSTKTPKSKSKTTRTPQSTVPSPLPSTPLINQPDSNSQGSVISTESDQQQPVQPLAPFTPLNQPDLNISVTPQQLIQPNTPSTPINQQSPVVAPGAHPSPQPNVLISTHNMLNANQSFATPEGKPNTPNSNNYSPKGSVKTPESKWSSPLSIDNNNYYTPNSKRESIETPTPKSNVSTPDNNNYTPNTKQSVQQGTPLKSENNKKTPADPVVLQQLNDAMAQKKEIWISYNGGRNPGVARSVTPLRWANKDVLFVATCGQSKTQKNWCANKVLEIRDYKWERKTETIN